MLQLERERLLEDHDVDALPELRAQQRLAQRDAALRRGDGGHQRAFEQHELDAWRAVAAGAHRRHDRIHDQRADVGDRGRHECRRQV